jgi:hypothetical protein
VNFKFGFGKKEIVKAAKGAGVAGTGAVVATALNEVGILPDLMLEPPSGPFIYATIAVGVNVVRQFIKDNTAA